MSLKANLLIILFVVTSCTPNNQPKQTTAVNTDKKVKSKVIYGDDNRLDLYQVSQGTIKEFARSTIAIISSYKMVLNNSNQYDIATSHYGQSYGLCKTEPFYSQRTAPHCSGSLVSPNLVLTAGHCVSSQSECSDIKIVFDYAKKTKTSVPNVAQVDNVYSCVKVIHTEVKNSTGSDFAVIQLDRNVIGRKPLQVNRESKVNKGDSLFVIGHPSGLPTKVAGGAQVRSLSEKFFVANLDTYGGNSGSAVFNAKTGKVEGILVRGDTDYTYKNGCSVSNICKSDGCDGEEVTYVKNALSFIPAIESAPPRQPAGNALLYSSNPNLDIPDNDFEGIYDAINVNSPTYNKEVLVNIKIKHPWRGDLVVVLIPPSGNKIVLHNRSGSYKNDISGTYGVNLESSDPLNLNQETSGNWVLYIRDLAREDYGTLESWSLEVK